LKDDFKNFNNFTDIYPKYSLGLLILKKIVSGRMRETLYYMGADKSLDRPTSRFIFFNGEGISFDASLVLYI